MKKVFITVAMVLVCFQCLSFAGSPVEDEKILSEERALSVKPQTVFNADDVLNIIKESPLSNKEKHQFTRESWYSTDLTVMNPLLGTKWIMNYKISSIWSDVLIFGSQATTSTSGYAYLSCSTQSGSQGGVFYTDLPQGGQGFSIVILGTTLNEFYFF